MHKKEIPSKDIVRFVVKETIQNQKIRSQSELARIVSEKLKKGNQNYTVSGKRSRLIALEIPEIRVFTLTKHGKIPETCPCCSNELKKIYTKDLSGRKILLKLICSRCEYKGSEGKWIPKRYEFSPVV